MKSSEKQYETAHNEHINRFKMAHMIGVAEYMRERAKDYGVDPDVMYALGLLHDIGYLEGHQDHETVGCYIMDSLGMDDKYLFAVLHHGENPYEVAETFGKDVISPEFVLLLEADMSVDARGYRVGFDGRLEDIERRYGGDHAAYETAKANIRFIKEYQKEHGIGRPVGLYHKGQKVQIER